MTHQSRVHSGFGGLGGEYEGGLDVENHPGEEDGAESRLPEADLDAEAEEGEDDGEEGRREDYDHGVAQWQEHQAPRNSSKLARAQIRAESSGWPISTNC